MAVATKNGGYAIAQVIVELRETLPKSFSQFDDFLSTFINLLRLPLIFVGYVLYYLKEAFLDSGRRYKLITDFISTVGTKAVLNFIIVPRFFDYPKYCLIMGVFDFIQYIWEQIGHSYVGMVFGIGGCLLTWRMHEDSTKIWIGITTAVTIWLIGEIVQMFMDKILFQS